MWIALCLDYKLLLPHKLLFSTVVPRVSPLLLQLCLMVPLQGLFLLELKNPASASAASDGFISRFVLVLVGTQKPASASAVSDGSITRFVLWYAVAFMHYIMTRYGQSFLGMTCIQELLMLLEIIRIWHHVWDTLLKHVMSWDTRLANPLALFRNLGAEIDSISISGFDLIVAVGAAIGIYDLCGTMKAVDLTEPFMDVGIKLHCFSSIYYNHNVSFIILNMQFLVENFLAGNAIIVRTY
uniref:Uncharacterized protein n=1 Tax=Salix viminalis TaxID=40686 RepID=A0A6N2LTU9_SALVM